jgi:hypothetical protein
MNSFNTFQSVISNTETETQINKATITTVPSVTRTENGDYWVYTFTQSYQSYTMTFSNVSGTIPLSILAVGGGGGGGYQYGGGGGAGGFVEQSNTITLNTSLSISIGAGGSQGNN